MILTDPRPKTRSAICPRECRPCTATKSRRSPRIELGQDGINLKETLDNLENKLIVDALQRAGGVKNKAAKLLGLNRTTLIEKMKKIIFISL